MKKIRLMLPDKLFGKDVDLLLIWVVPVLVFLGLVIVFVNVILPRFTNVSDYFSQLSVVKSNIVSLNNKRLYMLSLDQNELNNKSLLVENGVLSEKNSYLLIKIIGKIVSEYGFVVSNFSVSIGDIDEVDKKVSKFDYQKLPVSVEISGPKDKFLTMVSSIEKSLPVLSIDEFMMESIGSIARIKMNVSAYYLPDWTQTKLESLSVSDLTPSKGEEDVLNLISGYKYYGASESMIGNTNNVFTPTNRVDPFY